MSTTTPNLTLTLYDSTTDQVVTFATFRAVWGGTATTSNFYRIDTWAGTVNSAITTLQNQRGSIPVSSTYVSANYYEATVPSITSYVTGMTIVLSVDTTSNGTVTLNINALGTKSLMKVDSTGSPINLTGSDLVDGRQYLFEYDGTRWLWVSANSADQIQIVGTSGNVVTVGSTNNLDGSTTPSSLLSSTIHAGTSKTTPVGADEIGIADSASSYSFKRLLLSNLYKALGTGTQDTTTFLRGDGTYNVPPQPIWGNITGTITSQTDLSYYVNMPNGILRNGKIEVSVNSNNITVSLKTFSGGNPSASDPVYLSIGSTVRVITSSLSVTKNAGTNWFNSGSSELATEEVDYFVYLGYNSTDGVVIGFSRIPYASIYSDFSTSSTNEKYCAISTITNASSTDSYVNIGRFAATLSAGSSYNWSVPTFTPANLKQMPTFETRTLSYNPVSTGLTVGNGTWAATYKLIENKPEVSVRFTLGSTSAVTGGITVSIPFTSQIVILVFDLFQDYGTQTYGGFANISGSNVDVWAENVSGTYPNVAYTSATVPHTWAVNDYFTFYANYIM